MISKYATAFALIGALLVPVMGNAEDRDKDRAHPKAWVKDSVITAKIKAEYAKDKVVSAMNIHVETDAKGAVTLSGHAKSKEEAAKAESIAKGVSGVTTVKNDIQVTASTKK